MEYRRSSMVLNRKQKASTNPQIYASFAGAGVNRTSNGILDDMPTMWWDEERIETTVTRQFVMSKLRPDEQERLDEPLGFGDGLTDDTYIDWIEEKAKKIFLILVDLGVPDQIFGVIDDSWDDDDLPIPLDQVERLKLTYDRDEKLEKKFFQRQFNYLLRYISKGEHVYYDDAEVIPLELVDKRSVGSLTGILPSNIDKVHLPGKPNNIFVRRRIPLGTTSDRMPPEEFLSGIEAMRGVEHVHLTSLWASYIYQDSGYLILTPANDNSLKSFLTITPQSFKILAKQDRRVLLLNWLHCLAGALAFLHKLGLSHSDIKPSTVMLDLENRIFLGDSSSFYSATGSSERRGFDRETYDYSAPEQHTHYPPSSSSSNINTRRLSSRPNTSSRSAGVQNDSASRTLSVSTDSSSISTASTSSQSENPSFGLWQNTNINHTKFRRHDPQKSDVFSLGTIFLEILTFLLKRASRNFASHRSSKNKHPGRGGGLPDASFHKNLPQVETWMGTLSKDASKKEDRLFRGVNQIVELCRKMLTADPEERPTAGVVRDRLGEILRDGCGMSGKDDHNNNNDNNQASEGQGQEKGKMKMQEEGRGKAKTGTGTGQIHCASRLSTSDWNFGFDQLRLASQRAAAEACANVAPYSNLNKSETMQNLPVGNGGVILGVERVAQVVPGPTVGFNFGGGGLPGLSMSMSGGNGDGSGMNGGNGREGDRISIDTKTSSGKSSEGQGQGRGLKNSSKANGGAGVGAPAGNAKPKAKAWQAPVYAELSFG